MVRNLLNRVETCFPIEDKKLLARVKQELGYYLSDNCQSWELPTQCEYVLNQPKEGEERFSAQQKLLEELALS